MAYYSAVSITSANEFIAALNTFAPSNGWTVDLYSPSGNYRLHMHLGDLHVDLQVYSASALYLYGCTGFNSGAAASAQPGVSLSNAISGITGTITAHFVSVLGGLYYVCLGATAMVFNGGFFTISKKVGSYTGGLVVFATPVQPFVATMYLYGQVYLNGSWSPHTQAKGLTGNATTHYIASRQPCRYNAAIVPCEITLFVRDSAGTKYSPIGFVPGTYLCNGGDIYSIGDTITIGSDDHVILPSSTYYIGGASNDLLFKIASGA